MTLKRKCKKCGHTQTLKDGRTTKTSWKCSDCGFVNKLRKAIIALVALIVFTSFIGLSYAEEVTVNVPFDFWNNDFCTFLGFPLENGTTLYEYECIWTGWEHQVNAEWLVKQPSDISIALFPDAPEAFIIIAPEFRQEIVVDEPEVIDLDAERRADIEERRIEMTVEKERLIGELAECRTGLGAFAAYQEQEAIQDYTNQTRWQFAIRDNLSQSGSVLTILKAIEECDIMKEYVRLNLISEFELNKVLADLAGTDYLGRGSEHPLATKVTDQSDSMVFTDPVTPRDIAQEVEEAQRIFDELYRDPNEDFSGINRGGQPAGLKCQVHGQPAPVGAYAADICPLSRYDQHILTNWESITYMDILQLQCDNFLYIYQHKIGTHEFPVWLNHCVPKVVREG